MTMAQLMRILVFTLLLVPSLGGLEDLVVAVLSQQDSWHVSRTTAKVEKLKQDVLSVTGKHPVVLASYELAAEGADWTILPLLKILATHHEVDWFFFITEQTQVNFTALEEALVTFDPSEELFLGHALSDSVHTITHHYYPPGSLLFPHLPSGILLSGPALYKASDRVQDFKMSFNIDPMFEFAKFLKYHRDVSSLPSLPPPPPTSLPLTHLPRFCFSAPPLPADGSCATVYREDIPDCREKDEVTPTQVHFAVKTCSKFHSSRLPVVHQTWGKEVEQASITYYSDVQDQKYSTIFSGVPNTETGHCGKTVAIVRNFHVLSKSRPLKWLVIADDDTLLSVPRLLRLLRCYDHHQAIFLGEAYGYEAHTSRGYTYITGGGGMVLSDEAVTSFVESGLDCPANQSPDDMYLGSVAKRLQWDVVHSSLFHQSQPPSFPEAVLKLQESISFHRHTPLDPLLVYSAHLQDQQSHAPQNMDKRTEL